MSSFKDRPAADLDDVNVWQHTDDGSLLVRRCHHLFVDEAFTQLQVLECELKDLREATSQRSREEILAKLNDIRESLRRILIRAHLDTELASGELEAATKATKQVI